MPHHVFISYAHLDNKPLLHNKEGWISKLDEALTNLLSQKIGEEAKVWRDKRMQPDPLLGEGLYVESGDAADLADETAADFIKNPAELDAFLVKVKTAFQANSNIAKEKNDE